MGLRSAFGGATTGASLGSELGTVFGGPAGTAIGGFAGGGLGFLSGLFTNDTEKPQEYYDPYEGRVYSGALNMMNSNVGALSAQNANTRIERRFRDRIAQLKNNPNFGMNAAVTSKLTNLASEEADNATADANVQGAQLDQQTRTQGLGMLSHLSDQNFNRFQYNNDVRSSPGLLEQIGENSLGYLAGDFLSNRGNNEDDPDTGYQPGQRKMGLQNMAYTPKRPSLSNFGNPGRADVPLWNN